MKLYNVFGPNMVFQQERPFEIRGEGASSSFSIKIRNERTKKIYSPIKETVGEDGSFSYAFKGIKGSFDKYTIVLKDNTESIEVRDVMFGDVILYFGQSNMSYTLQNTETNELYKERIKERQIYCLNILESDVESDGTINRPPLPKNDISDKFKWERVDGSNVSSLSALAVMSACIYQETKDYPVGFIVAATGGLSIDSLLPYESIEESKPIKKFLRESGKYIENPLETYNTYGFLNYTQMSGYYNEKINPLTHFAFNAFVFYQGENSCFDFKSGRYYKHAIKELISSYRRIFGDGRLRFIITGIADEFYPYGDQRGYFYIQEVLSELNTGYNRFVPIHDIDSRWILDDDNLYYHPIHPVNKEEIARRYATLLNDEDYFYPYIESSEITGNSIILKIKSYKGRLEVGRKYFGFTISGNDSKYMEADAESISENEIRLSSRFIESPKNYTYGMIQYPLYCDCKLDNGDPLIQKRSVIEPFDKSTYLLNLVQYGCKDIQIRENNFSLTAGGGFPVPLFEKGSIIRVKNQSVTLRDGIRMESFPDRDSYYYYSLRMNLSISGFKHNLDSFKHMAIRLKLENDVEFDGIIFRSRKGNLRFPPMTKGEIAQSINLEKGDVECTVSLENYMDGSDAAYKSDPEIVRNITEVELMFRGFDKSVITLKHMELLDDISDLSIKEKEEKRDVNIDSSMFLPPSND